MKRFTDSDLRWLFVQIRPHIRWQIASVVFMVAGTVVSLADPLILKWLIDVVLPSRRFDLLALGGAFMLAAYGGRVALAGISGLYTYHVFQKVIRDLRVRLFKHVTGLSMDYHAATPVGTTLFAMRDTLEELGTISADFLPQILRTLALSVLTIGTMVHLNFKLALIILPLVPAFVLTIRYLSKNLRHTSDVVQSEGSNTLSFLQEHLGSVMQIQLLVRERSQMLKAFRAWAELMRAGYKRKRAEYVYGLCSSLIVVSGVVAVVLYGGYEVIRGALTIGGLVAFYSYLGRLFEPLYVTVDINSRLQRARVCIQRMRQLLSIEPAVKTPEHPVELPAAVRGCGVVVPGLSFSYGPRPVLENFSLTIAPGERIALVGLSGSGKSTIAKLLTRLYDTQPGQIFVDKIDIRNVDLQQLRRHVCYVPQRAMLFNGTLNENLKYGNPQANDLEVQEAIDISGLAPVLEKLPLRAHQPIGPGGGLLSGGERQRVAIARAVLQKPRLLILDEATSEIDSLMEQQIFEQLHLKLPDVTMILISHRLGALVWVDRVVFMSEGKVADSGPHHQVYGRNSLYTQLHDQKATAVQLTN